MLFMAAEKNPLSLLQQTPGNKLLKYHFQPMQALPYAILGILKSLGQIPNWLALSDLPVPSIDIPEDFLGINVAPADDPAIDNYIVERLNELGIRQVRMDFAYSSIDGAAQRLLNRLLSDGFDVLLDIFPDPADAKVLYKST